MFVFEEYLLAKLCKVIESEYFANTARNLS